MNENQMLATFSDEFAKFREDLHSVINDLHDYETTNSIYEKNDIANKRIEELDQLIADKTQEMQATKATINSASNLSDEEREILTARITRCEEQIKGSSQEKEAIAKELQELDEENDTKLEDFKNRFKISLEKMKKSLGFHVVRGKDVSLVHMIMSNVANKILIMTYQLETLKAELNETKGMSDRKNIVEQMQSIVAERKKLEELVKNLNQFLSAFEELEKVDLNSDDELNIFHLFGDLNGNGMPNENSIPRIFERVADAVITNVDSTLISVNIITNEDGTYSLDMRCGNKICEPRPLIPADSFNKTTVNQYLKGFASVLSLKTDLKYEDLEASKVILKTNGVDLGRHEFKTIGEMSEKIKEGKRDEVLAAIGTPTPNEGEQPTPENQNEPTKENQNQPTQENEPTKENQNQPTQTGQDEPTQENENEITKTGNDTQPIINQNTQSSVTSETDEHAIRVTNIRNANTKAFSSRNTGAYLATLGLLGAGLYTGIGVLPAIVAGGYGLANIVARGAFLGYDAISYACMKQKLKNVAKKMSKETKKDIRLEMDTKNRKAYFVLVNSEAGTKTPLTSEILHNENVMAAGLDDKIIGIFDNAFASVNEYRGKGMSAKKLSKEWHYRDFPKITFDNVTAAFNAWGGIKTRKERKEGIFNIDKILHAREQEEVEDLYDEISGVEPEALEDKKVEDLEEPVVNSSEMGTPTPVTPVVETQTPVDPVTPVVETQTPKVPVQPLAPITSDTEEEDDTLIYADQDILMNEITKSVHDSVSDPTNNVEVYNALMEEIKISSGELSPRSMRTLINNFHDEVGFSKEQMEKLDLVRRDRTLSDAELKDIIRGFEPNPDTFDPTRESREQVISNNVSEFVRINKDSLTKADFDALVALDPEGKYITEELINGIYNGRSK